MRDWRTDMEINNLKIVMLLFQPSVIARGMEKKLVEMGNTVSTVVGDFIQIDSCIEETDIFIVNLPAKITDDAKSLRVLSQICESIVARKKNVVVVGEKELIEEVGTIYRGIAKFQWVYRPVETDALCDAIAKALEAPVQKAPTEKRRILIVDDDPSYAKMVREWIKDFYRVDIVTAGMQAITFLVKVPPEEGVDLILLDYEMPVVDGPQVLQMLRQEPATANIPVIFLTGIGDRESVARVMSLKPSGYILKSTTRDNLLNVLESKLPLAEVDDAKEE